MPDAFQPPRQLFRLISLHASEVLRRKARSSFVFCKTKRQAFVLSPLFSSKSVFLNLKRWRIIALGLKGMRGYK